ncbi:SirB2 family protein [Fontimonas sp. SYSU GA230001]|uniref:SirB2 family protein n=1 Tax=Fontimonas sp. SYSU GA230001 TaxID=3142450 RepID=UPI0032B3CEC6
MDYLTLRGIHIGCVIVSGSLFLLRGVFVLGAARAARWRLWRWLPHLIDTVLLVSAAALAWTIRQYPFVHAWLTVKVLALPLYIALGSIALKRGRTRRARAAAFVAALAVFLFIVSVARRHDAWGWFAGLAR